mmetsp:Transcript_12621/g.53300  ORF Transcript_12621/g.53300 Transcript_12621/m.53300 type:complete len:225 (-) Transcript_12621:68-742(-)
MGERYEQDHVKRHRHVARKVHAARGGQVEREPVAEEHLRRVGLHGRHQGADRVSMEPDVVVQEEDVGRPRVARVHAGEHVVDLLRAHHRRTRGTYRDVRLLCLAHQPPYERHGGIVPGLDDEDVLNLAPVGASKLRLPVTERLGMHSLDRHHDRHLRRVLCSLILAASSSPESRPRSVVARIFGVIFAVAEARGRGAPLPQRPPRAAAAPRRPLPREPEPDEAE